MLRCRKTEGNLIAAACLLPLQERGRWLHGRKTKSFCIAGIIQTRIDKVSITQRSSNLSVLGKEEIMTTVSAKMGFLGGSN